MALRSKSGRSINIRSKDTKTHFMFTSTNNSIKNVILYIYIYIYSIKLWTIEQPSDGFEIKVGRSINIGSKDTKTHFVFTSTNNSIKNVIFYTYIYIFNKTVDH